MMIEEIPLTFVFDDGMVVCPACHWGFVHNDTLELKRSHRRVAHGVCKSLGRVAHPWEGVVVFTFALEDKGSFLESLWQVFHRLGLGVEFHHVVLQACHPHTHSCPIDIRLAILGVDEHTGVDAIKAFDRSPHRLEWSFGIVGYCHSHAEALLVATGSCGEIEVVSPVLLHAVGSPHGVGVALHPWHLVLGDDNAVVGPIGEIIRRKDMIILHREPFLLWLDRTHDVVRRIDIHPSVEHSRRGVGGILVADDGVLRHHHCGGDPHQSHCSQ